MAKGVSERAEVLKRVLKYINVHDWEDHGDYLEFGVKSKSRREGAQTGPLTARDEECLDKVSDKSGRFAGKQLSRERTSLEPKPDIEILFAELADLATGHSERMIKYVQILKGILTEAPDQEAPGVLSEAQIDALDQRYAEEVLGKLEKVVSRASRLQTLDLEQIPRRNVQLYFEEAHRCYLYGFKVACAVLCRAILESALKETIDPKDELRPRERGESHILKMINKAKIIGRLADPLPEWAGEVKEAGDKAVHNVEAYERDYPPVTIEHILDNTRKILESLYQSAS